MSAYACMHTIGVDSNNGALVLLTSACVHVARGCSVFSFFFSLGWRIGVRVVLNNEELALVACKIQCDIETLRGEDRYHPG